jgi:hypothetical protein
VSEISSHCYNQEGGGMVVVVYCKYMVLCFNCVILVAVISNQDSTKSECFSLYPSALTVILWCNFGLISVRNTVDE